ncbi:NEDD4-binding protein 2 [Chytriomyces hyalinus]|nr:NEDD4-binding protein 2 [Chytriomyces hyalinus]
MPQLIIMRGCSGSGKSTLVKQILQSLREVAVDQPTIDTTTTTTTTSQNTTAASEATTASSVPKPTTTPTTTPLVFSTDDFWLVPSNTDPSVLEYRHDISRISEAHAWNQTRAFAALNSHAANTIIIDNTNLCRWEARPYVECALRNGYEIVVREPDTWWWRERNAEELFRRGTHGVPFEAIRRMCERYEVDFSVEAILASEPPPPPQSRFSHQRGGYRGGYRGNGSNRGN